MKDRILINNLPPAYWTIFKLPHSYWRGSIKAATSSYFLIIFACMTTFKEFASADITSIVSMMQTFNAIDNYPFDRNERIENLELLLSNNSLGKLWLIFQDGIPAGYTFLGFGFSFEFKGRDAFVDELFILPEFQGKGIGKQAIDFIIDESRKVGIKALHLEAEHHNERGLRLYRQKGFKDHKRFLLTKFL
jgi:GNAT superfamily N-acetyltransferase